MGNMWLKYLNNNINKQLMLKKKRKQRNNAQMYGNMFDKLWTERIDIVAGNDHVQHKAGPREIGKIRGWKGYKYDEEEEMKKRAQKKNQPIEKVVKAGPRDIGTAH